MSDKQSDKKEGGDRERVEFALPSGKMAAIVKYPKGKDMRLAGRMGAAHPNDPTWQNYCLVAQTTLIDGKEILPDEIDDMSLGDVNHLVGRLMEISEGKFPASAA